MSSDEGTSVDAPLPAAAMGDEKANLTSKLLSDPGLMQAFGGHLESLIGSKSSYIDSMPKSMKRRIRALKKIQVEYSHIEAKFYEEVQALERKYTDLHRPLDDRRRKIVMGEYEPTEEESVVKCEEDEDDEDMEEEDEDEDEKDQGPKIVDVDENGEPLDEEPSASKSDTVKYDQSTQGIPEFWLTALKNVDVIAPLIQENDEPLLRHLTDIELKHYEAPLGFDLIFHFSENKYISNQSLAKHYDMKIEVDEKDPFSFEGPQITGCNGCEINWQKGSDLTVKTVKKKQKGKGKGQPGKTVTKQVPAETFFSFFSPPDAPDQDIDEEEMTDEQEEALSVLATDYEMASFIRDHLIRKAVLVFTGQHVGDEGEGSMFDLDPEEAMAMQAMQAGGAGGANPQECAQQ